MCGILDQIRRLVDDYCWYADTRDVEGIVSLFTPEGVFDATPIGLGKMVGTAELRQFFQELLPVHEYSQHLSGNCRIDVDVDGEAARGMSYYSMQGAIKGSGPISAAGYYEDRYVLTPDGWRIEFRRGVPLLPSNLEAMTSTLS